MGIIELSSAKTKAMMTTAAPPMSHEMMAAGPAFLAVNCAVNNQPEPRMALTDAKSNVVAERERFMK